MILEKIRSCLWKLELGFWTYGWIRPLGPSGPNLVSRPQTPTSKNVFEISWFYWIYLMFLKKIRSCFWKLELWLWTYSLIRFLHPIGPNVVSRPQIPRWRNLLRFHDFIGFISWFLRSSLWKLEPELMARLMAAW